MKFRPIYLSFALLASSPLFTVLNFAQAPSAKLATPLASSSPGAVPALVPYSGVIEGREAKPSSTGITFLIYKDEGGGEPLFAETQAVAIDLTGHYKVQLGASSPSGIPAELFSTGEARWLEVQVTGEKPQPRILLASVPYALKAADSATLGGLPASAFVLAGSTVASAANSLSANVNKSGISTVTTTGGTANNLAVFSGANTVINSILIDNGVGIGVGKPPSPSAVLDVNGPTILRGDVQLQRLGNATSSQGYNSHQFNFTAQAYKSSNNTLVNPTFQWRAEVTGNNTAAPSANFSLLATDGVSLANETGLYLNTRGIIHFAPGQTFPGGTGTGTITGVTAGTGLTGGGTSGTVTLKAAVPFVLSGSANGVIQGQDSGGGYGVYGKSVSGFGVYGESSIAVAGNSSSNIGVYGTGPYAGVSSYGGSYGVLSTAYNTSGTADGINTTGANGVYARSNRAGGNGVYATASNGSAADYAIWGVSSSGYAGVFSGNVSVSGTLSKAAGTFRIDHPLDPENKYLSHSFVESPDMMNIYNGIAALDGNGEATVQMPDYFAALNKDYRYQLTAIGAPGPNLFIAQELVNNRFRIAGGKGGMKVSWQVTGVRQDAYANAHRTPVEEDKPGMEKGTYLHPELFAQPEEKSIEWALHPQMMRRMKSERESVTSPMTPIGALRP